MESNKLPKTNKVYVIVMEAGSYSDYSMGLCEAFLDSQQAIQRMNELNEKVDKSGYYSSYDVPYYSIQELDIMDEIRETT